MYHRGTLAEFNSWHIAAMEAEDIPVPGGKIGFINGVPAPDSQRTTSYSAAIQNLNNSDDYIWQYGSHPIEGRAILTAAQAQELTFLPQIN